jgi:hypothetical protein
VDADRVEVDEGLAVGELPELAFDPAERAGVDAWFGVRVVDDRRLHGSPLPVIDMDRR